jgi:DnaJ-class molecular chaperone
MKEPKSDDYTMVCPDCDASGYTKDKDNKSIQCERCKGTGLIYNDKKEPNQKSS